jgi:hypothetical protein
MVDIAWKLKVGCSNQYCGQLVNRIEKFALKTLRGIRMFWISVLSPRLDLSSSITCELTFASSMRFLRWPIRLAELSGWGKPEPLGYTFERLDRPIATNIHCKIVQRRE